jgi:hypothetical protein
VPSTTTIKSLAAQPTGKGTYRYPLYKASDALRVYNVTREFAVAGK